MWSNSCLSLQSHLMPTSVLFTLLQLMWIFSTLFYLKVCLLGIFFLEHSFPRPVHDLHPHFMPATFSQRSSLKILSEILSLHPFNSIHSFTFLIPFTHACACACVCVCVRERGRRVGGGEGEKEKDIKVHTEMDKYLILFLPLECKCWRTET